MEIMKVVLIVLAVIILLMTIVFVLYKRGFFSTTFFTERNDQRERKKAKKLGKDEQHEELYFEGKQVELIISNGEIVRIIVSDDKGKNTFGCQNGTITSFYDKGKEVEYKLMRGVDSPEVRDKKADCLDKKADCLDKIKKVNTDLTLINEGEDSKPEEESAVPKTHKIKDRRSMKVVLDVSDELLEGISNKSRTIDEIRNKEVKELFFNIDSSLESTGTFKSLASEYLNNIAIGAVGITSMLGIGSIISAYAGSAVAVHGAMAVGSATLAHGIGVASTAVLGTIALPLFALGVGFSLHKIIKKVNRDDITEDKIEAITRLSKIRKGKEAVEKEIGSILSEGKDIQADMRCRYLVDWLVVYDSLMRLDFSE